MYHQTTLLGHVGSDVELRYTNSGVPVANFSVAVNKLWTDNAGERHEKTYWYRVTTWRTQADVCAQHLTKGRQVYIVGTMEEPYAWNDDEGKPHARLELTATLIKFLGNRPTGTSSDEQEQEPEDQKQASASDTESEGEQPAVPEDIPF